MDFIVPGKRILCTDNNFLSNTIQNIFYHLVFPRHFIYHKIYFGGNLIIYDVYSCCGHFPRPSLPSHPSHIRPTGPYGCETDGETEGRKRPKEPPFTSNFIPLGLFLPRSGPSPYGSVPVPFRNP